jgi:hypothetical protein
MYLDKNIWEEKNLAADEISAVVVHQLLQVSQIHGSQLLQHQFLLFLARFHQRLIEVAQHHYDCEKISSYTK